ncbi:MAG TPA: DUF5667 domain-containing protein [Candidatus Methylomirabilis sp.]|nr:DUF5667 domain-containing protein [Candidatus Methylomirabilis sp.]
MRRDIYRIIRSLRDRERGINPDPAWVRATRDTLLMQVRNTMPSAETEARRRMLPIFAPFYARLSRAIRGPVLATLSISSVALGGSIASVSAAERAIPGDTLYAVKLVTEQARLALTSSKNDKVRLKAEFTKRRVGELKTIVTTPVSKREERAAQATDILKRDLDTLKQQLTDAQANSTANDAADVAKTIDKNAVEVVKALNETKNNLPPDVKEKVAAAQAQAADVGLKALEALVSVRQDTGDSVVSASDIDSSLAAHTEVAAATLAETKALAGSATSTTPTVASLASGSSTAVLKLAQDAEQALGAVQQLVQENKLDEAVGLIKDATAKSFSAQKQVEEEVLAITNASTTISASTANATGTSSTSSLVGSGTSTMNGTSPTSSTSMTTSTKP